MAGEDPEAFLRAMVAPLRAARRGGSMPGVPFSREAVANAFVMLGLLPEARAEQILAEHRTELEARGFRLGVLTGELSVRPGAHGYQDALAASPADLTRVLPGDQRLPGDIESGLSVTDDLGRTYRLRPGGWQGSPAGPGRRRWGGTMLAEPRPAGSAAGTTKLVSIQLYGHPWVSGEYWPMIAPCFEVPAAAKRIRVIVSTLWEAAWAEIDIPGR